MRVFPSFRFLLRNYGVFDEGSTEALPKHPMINIILINSIQPETKTKRLQLKHNSINHEVLILLNRCHTCCSNAYFGGASGTEFANR
jgi:hypothetical protein